jgi:hypothetical protein
MTDELDLDLETPVASTHWPKLAIGEVGSSVVIVPCLFKYMVEAMYAGKPDARRLADEWLATNASLPPGDRMSTWNLSGAYYQALRAGNQFYRFAKAVDSEPLKHFAATKKFLKAGQPKNIYYLKVRRTAVLVLDASIKTDFEDEAVGTRLLQKAIEAEQVCYFDELFFDDDNSFMGTPSLQCGQFLELKNTPQKSNPDFGNLRSESRGHISPTQTALLAEFGYACRLASKTKLPIPYLHSVEDLETLFNAPAQDDVSQLQAALARGASVPDEDT